MSLLPYSCNYTTYSSFFSIVSPFFYSMLKIRSVAWLHPLIRFWLRRQGQAVSSNEERTKPSLRFPKKSSGCCRILSLIFSTAAVLARYLHPPPAAVPREPQRATLVVLITRRHRYNLSTYRNAKNAPLWVRFRILVAETGLEPAASGL